MHVGHNVKDPQKTVSIETGVYEFLYSPIVDGVY